MYGDRKILGLIPARGGSKGIPGKNIRSVAGKPLVVRAVEAGLASEYIDDVVVTTDSEQIAEVARSSGALVPFLRPAALAQDSSKTVDCVVHALQTLSESGVDYDAVVLLQPTSPLRRSSDIDAAIELFYETGETGVVSISMVHENPVLMRTIDDSGKLSHLISGSSTVRRQDMESYYRVDGCIYINAAASITLDTSFNDNPYGYIIPEWNAIDIDDMSDLEEADRRLRFSEHH